MSPEQVWAGWTKPEHLVHWFTPAPWKTLEAECDLRPVGLFRSVMAGPSATLEAHKQMGFHDGWGKALDQLIAHMKQLG
ncbi:SRPBCC domain-containing protein [Duganella sp. LjRoot269]|uniref:SRPBCC domain-containing protein n=1 Tax=Duganella sp. LjRoot269 TaxID=3342305 RepID=UPI003ECD5994